MEGPHQFARAGIPAAYVPVGADAGRGFVVVAAGDYDVLVDCGRGSHGQPRVRKAIQHALLHIDKTFVAEARREFASGDVKCNQIAAGAGEHSRVGLGIARPVRQTTPVTTLANGYFQSTFPVSGWSAKMPFGAVMYMMPPTTNGVTWEPALPL